jgi:hypothetical protein
MYAANQDKASSQINGLKAVYKRVKAMEKKRMKPEARKLHKAVPNNNVF